MEKRTRNPLAMILSLLAIAVIILGVFVAARAQPGPAPQPLGPVAQGSENTPVAPDGGATGVDLFQFAPDVGYAEKMDVSPPLSEIPVPESIPPVTIREMGRPGETGVAEQVGPLDQRPQIADPVLQSGFGAAEQLQQLAPSALVNFEGVSNVDGVYPPDTNGDVGPNHYVQWVNLSFAIWDKNGNKLYGPAKGNTIWTGFGGPCESQNAGDPVVLYDQLADRWLMTQFTGSSPYGECVAVSTTGDPTGSYYRYFFQFSTSVFYDYPKLGVWPDAYYLTANRFGALFQGASAIALERDKMLAGQPARFVEFKTSTSYGTLLPADLEGSNPPPGGSPEFILERGSTALRLWKFKVDWNNTASSTFSGPTQISVAAYNTLCSGSRSCVPQPDTSVKLDGLGDRLMHRVSYRNFGTYETLLASHAVNASSSGTQAGVRWYEIRNPNGTPSVYQQGTFAPDANHRWMPSVAMDRDGNIAVVYSVSSSSVYPGIRYTGRLASDPLGQLPQGETTLIAGSGSQTGTGSRWGDYANISLDPVDDCTFWMTTEYMPSTGTAPWKTRIGAFRFPSCSGVSPTPTATSTPATPTATNTAVPPTPTNTPVPTVPIHVGDLDGSGTIVKNRLNASVTITVHDANHAAVASATVNGSWSAGGSSSCTTNTAGQCTVSKSNIKATSVTFTVTSVAKTGTTYNSLSNHDPDGDSNGTSITVR
jgi:hypothetical protein